MRGAPIATAEESLVGSDEGSADGALYKRFVPNERNSAGVILNRIYRVLPTDRCLHPSPSP